MQLYLSVGISVGIPDENGLNMKPGATKVCYLIVPTIIIIFVMTFYLWDFEYFNVSNAILDNLVSGRRNKSMESDGLDNLVSGRNKCMESDVGIFKNMAT